MLTKGDRFLAKLKARTSATCQHPFPVKVRALPDSEEMVDLPCGIAIVELVDGISYTFALSIADLSSMASEKGKPGVNVDELRVLVTEYVDYAGRQLVALVD